MSAVLLFGAGGQLGQDIVRRAALRHVPVVALSRAQADIADRDAVTSALAAQPVSLVVNAAAYTKVDRAESESDEAFRANAVAPGLIAQVCAAANVPLVHISTDYVFDGTKTAPYVEDDLVSPLGVYGASKEAGERAVRAALGQHIILRTSWVYGAHGANFLKTIIRLAAERDELRIVADQRGCPTSTIDIADTILSMAPRLIAREQVWGTYHFAGAGVTTWHDFATEIVEAQAAFTGRRPTVVPITTAHYPTPAKRPANSALDCSRIAGTLGIRAADWRQSTRDTVAALFNSD
jgi:dTDP-4-dehydrorhamnose reductase